VLYDNIGILSLPPQLSGTIDTPFAPDIPNYLGSGGIKPGAGGIRTFPDIATQRAEDRQIISSWISCLSESIQWTLGVQQISQGLYRGGAVCRYRGIHLNTQERINRQPLTNSKVFLPTYLTAPTQATLNALPYYICRNWER